MTIQSLQDAEKRLVGKLAAIPKEDPASRERIEIHLSQVRAALEKLKPAPKK
jgi:hypothetical protein